MDNDWYETCSKITRCERPGCEIWTNATPKARRGYWGHVILEGKKYTVCSRRCAELLRRINGNTLNASAMAYELRHVGHCALLASNRSRNASPSRNTDDG